MFHGVFLDYCLGLNDRKGSVDYSKEHYTLCFYDSNAMATPELQQVVAVAQRVVDMLSK